MFENNIPDIYTSTTAEDSPGFAGGDFSLSSIDFTRDFIIESHRGSSADDPGYISFRDQDGNVMSRFLDVYVDNFSLRCKHSPYNDRIDTSAFSLTPNIVEPSALLQESHSTQNNVEEAVQVTAHDCPPCNQVPAEEVASKPSFLSKIIQAFLWLFTPSSTTNTSENTECSQSDTSKCAPDSSESLEQKQEEVEVQQSALISPAPIETEPKNAVVDQGHDSEVQTDVAVLENTTETIIVDGEHGHFRDIAVGERRDEQPAILLDEADFTMLLVNEESSKTTESMPSDSLEDDAKELGVLLLQEGETVAITNTEDSQSSVLGNEDESMIVSLGEPSSDVETAKEVTAEVELAHDSSIQVYQAGVSQDIGEGVSTEPEDLSFDAKRDVEENTNTIGETAIA
ncbi:hypothetical protein [Anaplasma phagocytophilum]|uniref:hypothetical protein n=1 Tax=Anaplasma phagocytophilum TaxID=948 RepID=UPI003977349A